MRTRAFSLIELLVAGSIIAVLAAMLVGAGWNVYKSSSLAISANNIRQLAAGSAAYLAENDYTFWPYRSPDPGGDPGVRWWFGFESSSSPQPEGEREFDATRGPLGDYVPASLRPDPSLKLGGKTFKPKYRNGYLAIGYNVLLGGGWVNQTNQTPYKRFWDLPNPGKIVVFATSAQVNTLQKPASAKNPMIEEFYGFDDGGPPWNNPASIHFRHRGYAMVAFADGSAGFLPMDKSTLDQRAPKAAIGRFAPKGSTLYLLPATNP